MAETQLRGSNYLDFEAAKCSFLNGKWQLQVLKGLHLQSQVLQDQPCAPGCITVFFSPQEWAFVCMLT